MSNKSRSLNPIVYEGKFTFNKLTKTIVDYRTELGLETNVVIPDKISGVEVEHIADYAFRKKGLELINISDSVKTIGKGAFQGNNLKSIKLPKSTIVDKSAF